MTTARTLLLASMLVGAGCSSTVAPEPVAPRSLAARIDSILDTPPLHRTSWGLLVRDAATGDTIYARNAAHHFIPASNTKLVVTTVAMGTLGPQWRYRTPIFVQPGAADSSAAELRVVGTGDPTFSARFWQREHGATAGIAATIASSGLRHVRLLTIDASRFSDASVNSTWEVGDLPGTSAPPTAAFAIDEGVFRLRVGGGAASGSFGWVAPLVPAPVTERPQPIAASVVTDTVGARLQASTDYTMRRDTIYYSARIGAGGEDTVRLAMTDAAAYGARALAHALRERGVRVDSVRVVREAAPDTIGMRRIGTIESPPLADIVAAILQPSQNWIAEQLLKTLGAELGRAGSWSGGLAVERRFLVDSIGIDSLAFNLRDASGLSAQNLLTPTAIVQLLDYTRAQPWADRYRTALAAPDIAGSTLGNRLPALRGRVRGKTGTISNVNSLGGFLTTDSGRQLTFAIMSNGSGLPSASVRAAIDSTVVLLARSVR